MTYVPQEGKVVYGDSVDTKTYDALDFLALLSCHITEMTNEAMDGGVN